MLNDKIVRGNNFTCFHAGPKEGWTQFRLELPDVPLPARGKLFLGNLLGFVMGRKHGNDPRTRTKDDAW